MPDPTNNIATSEADPVPLPALALGLAGLIPFATLALLGHLGPDAWRPHALSALCSYGAIILSFMGGCRWGLAAAGLGKGPEWGLLGLSVLPALYGWGAMALPLDQSKIALALGLLGLLAADLRLTRFGGAPAWWPRLRLPLSLGAVAGLLAGASAV